MPNFQTRNLGQLGVISDVRPYDLPPNAISASVNTCFKNNTIERAPVFHRVHTYTGEGFTPGYIFALPAIAGGGLVEPLVTVSSDYSSLQQLIGPTVTDVTPLTWSSSGSTEQQWTSGFLGNVSYLNRASAVPIYKGPSDAQYSPLTNWDASWRCEVLRTYKDFLIALNVTKGAVEFPTLVKWSDLTTFGSVPASWDHTSTTNSAGENVLNEMREPIIDGLSLRDAFIIYGKSEVWTMEYVGGTFIFRFRKLFDDFGAISQNCVVQVAGLHYVFDKNDIYVHDGVSPRSIISGRNKKFVFDSLDTSQKHRCFVSHNPRLNEIMFHYPSDDGLIGFANTDVGCNRAAVYNYKYDTWQFYDMPNVNSCALAGTAAGDTYQTDLVIDYQNKGGSYAGVGDSQIAFPMYASVADSALGLTDHRILGLDRLSQGVLAKPIETEALKDAFVERVGLDLDENGTPLVAYKSIKAIFPQVEMLNGSDGVYFQFGSTDIIGQDPLWGSETLFDPEADAKVDVREAGRYLGYRVRCTGLNDFAFSGFDANITARGRRY